MKPTVDLTEYPLMIGSYPPLDTSGYLKLTGSSCDWGLQDYVSSEIYPYSVTFSASLPSKNIYKDGKVLVHSYLVPYLKKADVEVSVLEDIVKIKADLESPEAGSNIASIHKEFFSSSFATEFCIPEGYNPESLKAVLEDGVLRISLEPQEDVEKQKRVVEVS